MNQDMSLLALRKDVAHAKTKQLIKDLQELHECTCDEYTETGVRKCTCRFQWTHVYREIYAEQMVKLRGEEVQFTPAPAHVMSQRRIVERNNDPGMECPICYEPLELGRFCTKVVACRHTFHVTCAKRWFRNNESNGCCPMCRHQVIC